MDARGHHSKSELQYIYGEVHFLRSLFRETYHITRIRIKISQNAMRFFWMFIFSLNFFSAFTHIFTRNAPYPHFYYFFSFSRVFFSLAINLLNVYILIIPLTDCRLFAVFCFSPAKWSSNTKLIITVKQMQFVQMKTFQVKWVKKSSSATFCLNLNCTLYIYRHFHIRPFYIIYSDCNFSRLIDLHHF